MKRRSGAALALTVALALTAVSCATKKYVRDTVAPVQKHVEDLDKKTAAEDATQDASIAELGRGVSRADERAQGADKRAGDALRDAAKADADAAAAGKQAGAAQTLAEKGVADAAGAQRSVGVLGNKVDNLDNFKLASAENVLFTLGQSTLTKEAKAQLDAIAAKATPMKHYLLEVQGFTDSTGSPASNLALSERRAAAVLRYLTLDLKIPLFRVKTVGYGAAGAAADNKTRDGRKQNRRVQVSLYTPNLGA
jgi:outer membrane protein OmpA-like peptidoglycan-associated protein